MKSYDDDFGRTTQEMSQSNIAHCNMHSSLIRLTVKQKSLFLGRPLPCRVLNDLCFFCTHATFTSAVDIGVRQWCIQFHTRNLRLLPCHKYGKALSASLREQRISNATFALTRVVTYGPMFTVTVLSSNHVDAASAYRQMHCWATCSDDLFCENKVVLE